MKTPCVLLALGLGMSLSLPIPVRAAVEKVTPEQIAGLIERLGSNRFAERRQAQRLLDRVGAPALEALRKAVDSEDKEVSRLARELVARIEKREETAAALAPTQVHLVCKDMPVPEAVAALAKQSGYDIQITGTREVVAKRKITLDTGEVIFWEALDRLCRKAGLVEVGPSSGAWAQNVYRLGGPNPVLVPPARIMPVLPNPGIVPGIVPRVVPPAAIPVRPLPMPGRARPRNVKRAAFGAMVPGPAQGPGVVNGGQFQVLPGRMPRLRRINPVIGGLDADQSPYATFGGGQILLTEGKPPEVPTVYYGALRIRLKLNPAPDSQEASGLHVVWEVCAEPKLQNWSLSGDPRVNHITDDLGQVLTRITPQNPTMGIGRFGNMPAFNPYLTAYGAGRVQTAVAQFKLAQSPASHLKVLRGRLPARVHIPPQALITVAKILQAAGKMVRGAHGGSIRVIKVTREKDGDCQVQIRLEKPSGVDEMAGMGAGFGAPGLRLIVRARPGAAVPRIVGGGMIGPGGGSPMPGNLALVDAQGQEFQLVGSSGETGSGFMELTLTYRPNKDQGEPANLVYRAPRIVHADVPFDFADVKLP